MFSPDKTVCQAGGVPSTPPAAAETPRAPTSVYVAVGVMAVLASLLLLNGALTWFGRDGIATALADAGDLTHAEAERAVVVWLVPYLLIGLLLLAGAVFLPRRRRWAQWAGLAGSAALTALTLVSAFAAGGSTPASLLLLILSLAAITSLAARTTRRWVGRQPAAL
jgi:hypothetical protein